MQNVLQLIIPVAVVHLVVLVGIVFVIKRMLLSDTTEAVNRIKQVEAEVRKKEEGIRREIEEHEREFTRKKAEAEEALQQQKEAGEKEVAKIRDRTLADARAEAEQILEQAKRNEAKFREQIERDMAEKAVEYGGEVFRLVFSENMTEEINKRFIGELLDALEEVDAANITVDASKAEFIASHPLAADQKQRLERLLADKFGVHMKVQEKVQENLIAGLIFKLGSLEIDGSLRNRYAEAVTEVKKTAQG